MDFDIDLDEVDKKIVSILQYGERQQKELVKLIDSSEGTIRNHLEYLEKNGVINKAINGGSFYHLKEGNRKKVQPLPKADPESVHEILFGINYFIDEALNNESEVPYHVVLHFEKPLRDLNMMTHRRYDILSSEENFDIFFDIFDYLLDLVKGIEAEKHQMIEANKSYWDFFISAGQIYDNWEKGFDNTKYHSTLLKRTEKMEDALYSSPRTIQNALQMVLTKIDRRKGQKALVKMIAESVEDDKDLLNSLFSDYDSHNEIDILFDDLDRIKKDVDSEAKENIDAFMENYRRRYISYQW